MRVASKVGIRPSKFGHARPLGSRIIRYVRDGRADERTKATLIAPSLWPGGIIIIYAYVRGHVRKHRLRYRCQIRSAAFCQFAQHAAAAKIIRTAAVWTDITQELVGVHNWTTMTTPPL